MSALIKNLMLEMKLQGMLHSFEQTMRDTITGEVSPEDILNQLLQAEYDWREEKRTARLVKLAKLTSKPSLEDFDFTAKRSIKKILVKDLYKLSWLEQGRPIVIVGPTGVGKTFLAQALSHHACHHKHSTVFTSISTFLENLMLARSSNTYLKFRAKMIRPSLLVLDDFGLRKFSDIEAHDLNDIIKERLGEKSIIITTQLPMDHWSEVIEDPVIADTIIDQLTHSALKIDLSGESYRKVKAEKLDSKI